MHAHPNHKPGQTAIGCVVLTFVVILVAAACTALSSSSDSSDSSTDTAAAPPPVAEDSPDLTDEDITTLALDITWADMGETERDDLCWQVQTLGSEEAAAAFMDGAGPDTDLVETVVEDWLSDTCL